MEPKPDWIVPLNNPSEKLEVAMVGSKAYNLSQLIKLGFKVPKSICLTITAYDDFCIHNRLPQVIEYEINKKNPKNMRWEELWDAALRIRTAFQKASFPSSLQVAIHRQLNEFPKGCSLAVRSSAIGEDSTEHSFAGIHESILNVNGLESLLQAIKLVWSSLWSNTAMLYIREIGLNPTASKMPVVIQEMVHEAISGVAFGQDPIERDKPYAVIEAVPDSCQMLVDGVLEPDQWKFDRQLKKVVSWHPGLNRGNKNTNPLLSENDITQIIQSIETVEKYFNFKPDIEWTGLNQSHTLLQARPITTQREIDKDDDVRLWYKSLVLNHKNLKALYHTIPNERIPALKKEGQQLSNEDIHQFDNIQLANSILKRLEKVTYWRKIYKDEFIPFAHGVRNLGLYYNDHVNPDDPYEFVELLKGQPFLAKKRNAQLAHYAEQLRSDPKLALNFEAFLEKDNLKCLSTTETNLKEFILSVISFIESDMDFAIDGTRLCEDPLTILRQISMLTTVIPSQKQNKRESIEYYKQKLLDHIPESEQHFAEEIINIGQISWRLRDDDNMLLSTVESQFLKSINEGLSRVLTKHTLALDNDIAIDLARPLAEALINNKPLKYKDNFNSTPEKNQKVKSTMRPRQLIGQPASKGIVSGVACVLQNAADFKKFQSGNILICKAIQPMMTHLIPLASGIIEERGGMLIHGAIIARELNIPCVNGVANSTSLIKDGDYITLDGDLGMVTIGQAEFGLEDSN